MHRKSLNQRSRYSSTQLRQVRADAVKQYLDPAEKSKDIAARWGVSITSVSLWARDAGAPRRRRGRWLDTTPSIRNQGIILFALRFGQAEAGRRYGLCRARVCALMRRWKSWIAAGAFNVAGRVSDSSETSSTKLLEPIAASSTHPTEEFQ